jgi:hypothetical protein
VALGMEISEDHGWLPSIRIHREVRIAQADTFPHGIIRPTNSASPNSNGSKKTDGPHLDGDGGQKRQADGRKTGEGDSGSLSA